MAPKRKAPAPAAGDEPKKAKVGGADGKADGKTKGGRPTNAQQLAKGRCNGDGTTVCKGAMLVVFLLSTVTF